VALELVELPKRNRPRKKRPGRAICCVGITGALANWRGCDGILALKANSDSNDLVIVKARRAARSMRALEDENVSVVADY